MQPTDFPGAVEIVKPPNMTDEECMSIWAKAGLTSLVGFQIPPSTVAGRDQGGHHFFLTAWQPSYEDLQAFNRGEPVFIKTLALGLPPMAVFTLDENGEPNDAL